MQLLDVTAFWFRLAGNIPLDFFSYAHMFRSLGPRTGLYDELEHMHAKPSSHSGRIVGEKEAANRKLWQNLHGTCPHKEAD